MSRNLTKMETIGIDIGSREVKIVAISTCGQSHYHRLSTATFYRNYCSKGGPQDQLEVKYKDLLSQFTVMKLDKDLQKGASTGYGRHHTALSGLEPINEIKAHAYGAMAQTGKKDFVLLDIGGQDVKVVRVAKGIIVDLDLNDKCAASCGRYLENMAAVLEMGVEDLGGYFEGPVALSTTCAVFAESELVGKMAEGHGPEHLAAGVNYALYKRIEPMIQGYKRHPLLVSGGVAMNKALIYYLEQHFDAVTVLPNPQYNGAIGCCAYYNYAKKSLQGGKE